MEFLGRTHEKQKLLDAYQGNASASFWYMDDGGSGKANSTSNRCGKQKPKLCTMRASKHQR
jgi:hypothetical protein